MWRPACGGSTVMRPACGRGSSPSLEGDSSISGDERPSAARRRLLQELLGGGRGIGNVEDEAIAALGTVGALARIAALPPDQADVVLLRVIGDLSVAAVAEILDKRPGAVRALQHRALRNLAKDLSDQGVTE